VGVAERRLRTVENGVDVQAFTPERGANDGALREALGIPTDALVVGSVGRLVEVKAYDRLVRAMRGVRDRTHGAVARAALHLVIAGDGPERERLAALAAELQLSDVVHLPGWVQRPAALYRLCDLFALTSVSEGASLSLLEAMACGSAPVVTDVGGNRHMLGVLLRDQLVPPGDGAALERALASTLQSRVRRLVLGAAARQRVVARYNLDRVADAYRAIYRGEAHDAAAAAATERAATAPGQAIT
jgi:glycosyltransferase involved in cell wall biosynthesis